MRCCIGVGQLYQMQLLMFIQGIPLACIGQGKTVWQWRQAEHRFLESADGWQVGYQKPGVQQSRDGRFDVRGHGISRVWEAFQGARKTGRR
jgi:hypothetical protein